MISPSLRIVSTALAALCALAVPTVGAGPAAADDFQPFNGSYAVNIVTREGATSTTTWSVSSTCANEGCEADVTGADGFHQTALLRGGQWQMNGTQTDSVTCPSGTGVVKHQVWQYAIDATTLSGSGSNRYGGECGGKHKRVDFRVSLTKA